MAKRLGLSLPDDWMDLTDRSAGGTFTAQLQGSATGSLRIKIAERGRNEPPLRPEDLAAHAANVGAQQGWGKLVQTSNGKCDMGSYGTAAFRRADPATAQGPVYAQIWILSNGPDQVIATFSATNTEPSERELEDAQWIVEGVTLT